MPLDLEVVTECLTQTRGFVYPSYESDPRFDPHWWRHASAKSPVSYYSLLDDGEEVGRAKVYPGSGSYTAYTTWTCPPAGATEIDLIEIRSDLRRSSEHYGRQAVEAIQQAYGDPTVAMSRDETSDEFWRSLGWRAHHHPDGGRFRTLFTSA